MFRSFCITCRPRDGISDSTIEATLKWLNRHPQFAVAVLEKKDNERHLHAQLWYDEPKYKGDITKQLNRICQSTIADWDSCQKKVLAGGTKVAYNDWYLNYLLENDLKESPNIILENPPDNSDSYYPSQDEQDRVQRVARAVDPRYSSLEEGYYKFYEGQEIPHTEHDISVYLYDAMFISRTTKVVTNPRDRYALTTCLFHYINKRYDEGMNIPKSSEDKKSDKILGKFISENLNIISG